MTDAPERLLRFEREARFLASLNHPNIATLCGFEKAEDSRFLVMELVSGEPVWARSGKELFYRSENRMMAVAIETTPTLTSRKPRAVFEDSYQKSGWFTANYDVSPDGQHFLMRKPTGEGEESSQLNAIQNWAELLKRSTP